MDVTELLRDLNTDQQAAVTAPLSAVRVLAGAGSGKTRVLVQRIAWLIEVEGVSPWSIMAVTFTNKAAGEMRARVEQQLGNGLGGFWIGTFHAICHRFLRLHWAEAKLSQAFQVMDSDDQQRLVKRLIRAQGLDEKKWPHRQACHFINQHKDEGRRARHIDDGGDPMLKVWLAIYAAYETACVRAELVDFGELLLRTVETLRDNASLLQHYQTRFQHILVDEFQDTNAVQYAWLKLLSAGSGHAFVVGDDDQSIYGWRGARIANILNFDHDFEDTQTIRLEQNYRSTAIILAAANAVIANNRDRLGKNLWTEDKEGELIQSYAAYNEYDEARWVIETIVQYQAQGGARRECAILYRSNAQSRLFEEALIQQAIPYKVYGGLRFFERAEIKDALSYVRLMANRHDDVAFERAVNTPPRGIGLTTLEKIRATAREQALSLWQAVAFMLTHKQLSSRAGGALVQFMQLIEQLVESSRDLMLHQQIEAAIERSALKALYAQEKSGKGEDRIENLEELVRAAEHFEAPQETEAGELSTMDNMHAFLSNAALEAGDQQAEAWEDCVQLMTLHSAKGLEFSQVFLVGLEDGLFPSQQSAQDTSKLEEERRLAYVGITRAEQKLHLSFAEKRLWHGSEIRLPPSRFLEEIPKDLIHNVRPRMQLARPMLARQHKTGMVQVEKAGQQFGLGQTVLHSHFGEGVILRFEGSGEHTRVSVRFAEGEKILVLAYAPLTAA